MQQATAEPTRLELIEDTTIVGGALATQSTGPVAERPAEPPHEDALMLAMQRGYTPEQITQMMDLRDRQDRHVSEKAFREDFAAFRGENVIIPKSKEVDRGKAGSFMQAEYDQVCRRLSPALSRHGFGFRHDQRFGVKRFMHDGVESDSGWVWVTCYLEHRKGHTEKLELEGPPGDLSANTAVQNMQATASYLKRQSLLAITGTATGGEDDEAKLRNASGTPASEATDPYEALREAGQNAAMNGLAALTSWWGALDAKQRSRLNGDFGAMRRCATAADQGGHRG